MELHAIPTVYAFLLFRVLGLLQKEAATGHTHSQLQEGTFSWPLLVQDLVKLEG